MWLCGAWALSRCHHGLECFWRRRHCVKRCRFFQHRNILSLNLLQIALQYGLVIVLLFVAASAAVVGTVYCYRRR